MKNPVKKSKAKKSVAKKVRKTDKRQNPSARVAHRATKSKPKKKRTPRVAAPAPREVGLLDVIGEVMAEITDLGQEMRDWADSMPDSKQGGDKHSEVEGVADTLEGISDPVDTETMGFLNEIKITIQDPTPRRRGYSRSARLSQATDVLNDVISKLEEFSSETQDADRETVANNLRSELDDIESELQGVDFPGMYG